MDDTATIQTQEITLSRPQWKIYAARKERILNMAGQGGGKSGMIGFMSGIFSQSFPKMKGFIAANTYMQLNQSTLPQVTKMWGTYFNLYKYNPLTGLGSYVIDSQPPPHFVRFWEFKSYGNIISFENGHVIYVGSLDNYMAHDGKEFGYAHLDETKDTKENAIKMVILARLREKGVWYNPADPDPTTNLIYMPEDVNNPQQPDPSWIPFNPCYIHTSPAEGTVEWLTTMFKLDLWEKEILGEIVSETDFFYREDGNRAVTIYSTYHNAPNLPKNYIDNRKNDLTEAQQLKFIYGYPFSKTGGEYFTQFDRINSVGSFPYIPGAPIHTTWDFNVLPYMTMLCAQIHDHETFDIRFFKEYCLKSPQNSTRSVALQFEAEYQDQITDLFYYGDASGKNRIAGKGDTTNYDDLRDVLSHWLTNASDRVGRSNKPVLKRREFMERIFAGKIYLVGKRVRILVDSSCVELLKDLQYLMLGKEGKLKELAKNEEGASYQKLGHCFSGDTIISTSKGAVRIDQIQPGDLVYTRQGLRPVKKVFYNGIRPVLPYLLNGTTLRCTQDHKIYTHEDNYIEAQYLINEHTLCTFDAWKKSFSMALHSGDILEQNHNHHRFILEDMCQAQPLRGGEAIKAGVKRNFCTDIPGGSLMEKFQRGITSIIKMVTLSIMRSTTWRPLQQEIIKGITIQKKQMSGKRPEQPTCLIKPFLHQKNGMDLRRAKHGTELMHKNHLSSLIQSPESAKDVELNFCQKSPGSFSASTSAKMPINQLSTGAAKLEPVYDIEVDGCHEYFANGILVHNCSDAMEYLITELLSDLM